MFVPSNALHWIAVADSSNALAQYAGTWNANDQDRRSLFNGASRSTQSNDSLSIAFDGSAISLQGGMSFSPSKDFAACFVDGMLRNASPAFMKAIPNTNNNILCQVNGLADGPHLLTFNVTNIGPKVSSPSADDIGNRLWVDGIFYASPMRQLMVRQANGTGSADAPANSTIPAPASSGGSSHSTTRIAEIAGGIIGAALFAVVLRGVFFFLQRNDGTRKAQGRPPSPDYAPALSLPFKKSSTAAIPEPAQPSIPLENKNPATNAAYEVQTP